MLRRARRHDHGLHRTGSSHLRRRLAVHCGGGLARRAAADVDRQTALHEQLGERAKPLTCRLFPYSFHAVEDDVVVTASTGSSSSTFLYVAAVTAGILLLFAVAGAFLYSKTRGKKDSTNDMIDQGTLRIEGAPSQTTPGVLSLIFILGIANLSLAAAFQPAGLGTNLFLMGVMAAITGLLLYMIVETSNPFWGRSAYGRHKNKSTDFASCDRTCGWCYQVVSYDIG